MKATPDVKDIIKNHLIENGYDGLVNLEGECGCTLDDYHACGEYMFECKPAYKWENACKDCEHHCEGYDENGKNYCMRLTKQALKAAGEVE